MNNATKELTFADIATADLDTLTDELAAAGWDSTQTDAREAREAVVRLLVQVRQIDLDLCDEAGDTIREATEDEAVESVLSGPEGWIVVDGVRCYVTEA